MVREELGDLLAWLGLELGDLFAWNLVSEQRHGHNPNTVPTCHLKASWSRTSSRQASFTTFGVQAGLGKCLDEISGLAWGYTYRVSIGLH